MFPYMMSLGLDVFESAISGFILIAEGGPMMPTNKKNLECDGKVRNALYVSLFDKEFTKVMGCNTTKKI